VEKVESQKPMPHSFLTDLDAGVDINSKDYDFESSLRGWGDILRSRLHPRSLALGQTSAQDIEDEIRFFVEECDNVQGFHILCDTSEYHGDILSYIDDEFSSKCRVTFPLFPAKETLQWKDSASWLMSCFSSLHLAGTSSSLTVPLSCIQEFTLKPDIKRELPYLVYDLNQAYHTSAILASYLDTITLSYRTHDKAHSINDAYAGLTVKGWRFSGASVNLPFPLQPGVSVRKFLEERDEAELLWYGLSPNVALDNAWYQTFVLRGVADSSVVSEYIRFLSNTTMSLHSIEAPLPTLTPYPRIFSSHVSMRGSVDKSASRMDGFHVQSTPMLAGLHACPGVGDMLKSFCSLISKIDVRKLTGLELDKDIVNEKIEEMDQWSSAHSLDAEDDVL